MKRYLLGVVAGLLLAQPGWAQQPATKIDSVRRQLTTASADTNRVLLLSQLAYETAEITPVASGEYAHQALRLARHLGYARGECQAMIRLGVSLRNTGNFPAALELLFRAQQLAETQHNQQATATIYNALGRVYTEQKNHRTGLTYFLRCRALAKKITYTSLLTRVLGNIGEAYLELGKLDSASMFARQGYAMDISQHDHTSEVGDLGALGLIEARRGQDRQASHYYRLSLAQAKRYGITYKLPAVYLGLADLAQRGGQPDSVVYFARQALAAGYQYVYPTSVLDASLYLSRAYATRRDSVTAYRYLALATATRARLYSQEKTAQMNTLAFADRLRQQEQADQQAKSAARQRQYLLLAVLLCAVPLVVFLWRTNRRQQRANEQLQRLNEAVTTQRKELQTQRDALNTSLNELRATQTQLIQAEKMASLGELTAGIAHEIQNPLNFVNNFAEVSTELIAELREAQAAGDSEEVEAIASDLTQNLTKIGEHGRRAAGIVRGMLEHSRASTGERSATNLSTLADEAMRLAYHGLRAKDKSFNATLQTDFDAALPTATVAAPDVSRVLLNLFTNAFYAVKQRQLVGEVSYVPTVSVRTRALSGGGAELRVRDNGTGIPDAVRAKIFQPFFTTKPSGEGTGLGLSLSYDIIVKAHGGTLTVESVPGESTEFIITLPA